MDRALKVFIAVTVVTNTVLFGFRAVAYVLDYLAVGDLANGDVTAADTIRTLARWLMVDWLATIVSGFLLTRSQRRWLDAGNANALTQPGIGLGWFRGMPSSKAFRRWQWGQALGYFSIVFLNITFHNAATSLGQLRGWAVLEVMLCSVVIATSIAAAVEARRMTAELLERIDYSEQAARMARTAEPEPIG